MAVIFLLGPGMWDFEKKGTESDSSPLEVRRNIAKILRGAGQKNEDMIQKFIRLLHSKVTDVLLYWPPLAKMQTTYDELLLLYVRKALLRRKRISIWILHHASVAEITREEFKVLEPGNRSRYLTAMTRLGAYILEWQTESELKEQVLLLSSQLSR